MHHTDGAEPVNGTTEGRGKSEARPASPLLALAHLIDEDALRRAYGRVRKNAAVGVDGISKEQYGQDLEANLRQLHQRIRPTSGGYGYLALVQSAR